MGVRASTNLANGTVTSHDALRNSTKVSRSSSIVAEEHLGGERTLSDCTPGVAMVYLEAR
jgi:hypothetical protein